MPRSEIYKTPVFRKLVDWAAILGLPQLDGGGRATDKDRAVVGQFPPNAG